MHTQTCFIKNSKFFLIPYGSSFKAYAVIAYLVSRIKSVGGDKL